MNTTQFPKRYKNVFQGKADNLGKAIYLHKVKRSNEVIAFDNYAIRDNYINTGIICKSAIK